MRSELVTVMMPAYNAGEFIGQAIESVLNQSYPQWELIIVDDGSADHTGEIIGQFHDSRINLVQQQNSGESVARNRALASAEGYYLTFLDADDAFLPNHLEQVVGHMQARQGLDGVYTDGFFINQNGQQLDTLSSRRRGPFVGNIFEELVRSSDVFGPPICVALLNNRVKKLGMRFDERMVIGPDWDFMTRYSEHAQFDYIDQATCLYRIHQSNITVQASNKKRTADKSLCRQKAIKLQRFQECSVETKSAVFYDLLVELLRGLPEKQKVIIQWPEFLNLPSDIQARLLRLMASNAIAEGTYDSYVEEWIYRARQLNSGDMRGMVLDLLFKASPNLCRRLLKVKNRKRDKQSHISPFDSLALGPTS